MLTLPRYAGLVDTSPKVGGAADRSRRTDGADTAAAPSILAKLRPNTISECSLTKSLSGDGTTVCMSAKALDKIAEALDMDGEKAEIVLDEAKKRLGCKTERCAVKKSADILGKQAVIAELSRNFKVEGPTDNKLLNNVNIDNVMKQWAAATPGFFAYNFNMRDYASKSFRHGSVLDQPDTLATVDFRALYEGKRAPYNTDGARYTCCACVVNTDVYDGPGKHWMALFADARGAKRWTVEFFNSSGNSPSPEWVNWLQKTKAVMEAIAAERGDGQPRPTVEVIKSSRLKHQLSRSECGIYALFYIWARLNGIEPEYFADNRISDKHMFEFRQYLFSHADQMDMLGKKFDWDKFKGAVDIEWE
jgi:Ulp1 protease family, C-terminal catalytic domain